MQATSAKQTIKSLPANKHLPPFKHPKAATLMSDILPQKPSLRTSPEQWRSLGFYFRFRDHQIFYRDSGQSNKPVLLLIHGFPTASWDWYAIWTELEKHFRLIAPDMLGFGFSDKPKRHCYSIHEQADLHSALLAHLNVKQCHALVHDYGVSVMQELIARQKDKPATQSFLTACFLNGGLFPEMHRARFIQKALRSRIGGLVSLMNNPRQFNRSFSAVFGPQTQPCKTELDAFWSLIKQQQGHRILHRLIRYIDDREQHRVRWTSAICTPGIPVRLINGSEDPVSGKHLLNYYCKRVPQADAIPLNGIGHYPQVEAPNTVCQHYLEFIRPLL